MKEYHVHIRVSLANLDHLYDRGKEGVYGRECWECKSPTDCRRTEFCYRVNDAEESQVKGMDHPLCYNDCTIDCVHEGETRAWRTHIEECVYDVQLAKQIHAGDNPDQVPVRNVAAHYPSEDVRDAIIYLMDELGALSERVDNAGADDTYDTYPIHKLMDALNYYQVSIGELVPLLIK